MAGMTRAKICGITRHEDAELAVELGAWAIGLIRWDGSPRACDAGRAAGIVAEQRRRVELRRRVRQRDAGRGRARGGADPLQPRPAPRRRGPGVLQRGRAPHRLQGHQGRRAWRAWPTSATSSASTPTSTCSTPRRRACAAARGQTWDWGLLEGRALEDAADPLRRPRPRQRRRGDRRRAPGAVDTASGTEPSRRQGPREGPRASSRSPRRTRRVRMTAVEHRFGPYGGQFVPETLMPALAELEAAWIAARADDGYRAELERLLRDFAGRPTPLYRGAPALGGRRPPGLAQARGPEPHRRAQDQQRARPGAARPPHGQDADHRRDRRGPARRRDRHRVRAARPRVHRLHGHRGHAPPAAQRAAHGAARRDASSRSRRARGRSRRRSRRRSATGSPTSPTRTTSSARASARRRSRRSCATSSA